MGSADLVRYVVWLLKERKRMSHAAQKPVSEAEQYQQMRQRARDRNARLSQAGRDIAPYPGPRVQRPKVRERGRQDLQFFLKHYFPDLFFLPWSKDHLKVIKKIEEAVLKGGLFALAMPRGSGKTTICECACIWALLYGHRNFVCLIGSDEDHAEEMLATIKTQLQHNDYLHLDFKEVTHPVRSLEGITKRCDGQHYLGTRTEMSWGKKYLVLPTMPHGQASGGIVRVAGLTGSIKGMKHYHPRLGSVRPDLVILDDPQTDQSARSPSQCHLRESILQGTILGLAGPRTKISGIMPCTVIRPGDMADLILDREEYPEWQGERMKMVYSFPKNEKRWEEYRRILTEELRGERKRGSATKFYRKHRREMDEGAEVAWPQRYNEDELSGIQHAMNLKFRDEAAFWAEYQNEPLPEQKTESQVVAADEIATKVNGLGRGQVPDGCQELTAFIDLQEKVLFYVVCAWQSDFTGYVVDYGTYPEQARRYFTVRQLNRTLRRTHPGTGIDAALYRGLIELTGKLLTKEWPRGDGAMMRIGLCLIDQGWKADVVHQFCRQSPHAAVLMPARGHGITASQKPISEYDRKRGDRIGHHWWIPGMKRRRALRHVEVDTNYWKSFVHESFATAMGDPGCLSIFGRKAAEHRLFADHLTAEYRVRTEGRGRTVDEWKLPPSKPDNHWFDCLVGCAAAASLRGIQPLGSELPLPRQKKRIKLSDLQRQKMYESRKYSLPAGTG